MKILLTGATGFIGSHIAENLYHNGVELILTKRNNSNRWRCEVFEKNVKWINTDISNWIDEVIKLQPEIIIHAAWQGVSAVDREDWNIQYKNLIFLFQLFEIAKQSKIKKFIGIGSQAEYGEFNAIIDEDFPTNPNSAYSATKLAASVLVKAFCEQYTIIWYWFRLFSSFGEREAENWLIPATIKNMLTKNSMDLSAGEQRYSYLYVKDIAQYIFNATQVNAASGIYNLSSNESYILKDLITFVKNKVNPDFVLNFGALPYRKNQSMLNASKMGKTNQAFGNVTTDFEENLIQTINYYKEKYK